MSSNYLYKIDWICWRITVKWCDRLLHINEILPRAFTCMVQITAHFHTIPAHSGVAVSNVVPGETNVMWLSANYAHALTQACTHLHLHTPTIYRTSPLGPCILHGSDLTSRSQSPGVSERLSLTAFSGTADIGVHVVHIGRVIITVTLESLYFLT